MSVSLPNGQPPPSEQHTSSANPPPEIEATLSRLSAYRNVRGVMILSRTPASSSATSQPSASGSASTPVTRNVDGNTSELANNASSSGILRRTGAVFEDEGGRKYARAVEDIVMGVGKALTMCEEGDEVKFMRIRTKRHELIITPDEKYLLVVLQDPGS